MYYFITGKPGNGKTLYTIATIHKLQKESGRPVFYHGIPLLDKGKEELKWQHLDDPQKWYDCPVGSIIVIDEVQNHWRVRSRSSDPPLAITEMETHRHKGFDVFHCSQDPLFVDNHLRKLVWEHTHIKRNLGLERSTLYRWKQKVVNPENRVDLKEALTEAWPFPKEYYGYYQSAELHTANAGLPWKKIAQIAALFAFVVIGMAYAMSGWTTKEEPKQVATQQPLTQQQPAQQSIQQKANPWSADRWLPRVTGRPETAPAFDQFAKVRSQPTPSGCVQYTYDDGHVDCECRTWQGTPIDMPLPQCVKLVKHGWFDPAKPYEDKKALNIAYLNQRDKVSVAAQASQAPKQEASTGLDAGGTEAKL